MKNNIITGTIIFIIELALRCLFYFTVNYTIKDNYANYQSLILPFIFIIDLSGFGLFPAMSYYTSKNSNSIAPKSGYLIFIGTIFGILYLMISSIRGLDFSKIILSLSFLIMPYLQALRGFFQGMRKFYLTTSSIILEMITRILVYFIGYYYKYNMLITVSIANTLSYYVSLFYLIVNQIKYERKKVNGIFSHGLKLLPISTITSALNFFDFLILNIIQIPDVASGAYLFKILRLVALPIYFSRTLSSIFLVSNAKRMSKIYPLVIMICIVYMIIARPLIKIYELTYNEQIVMKLYAISFISSLLHSLIKIFSANLYTNSKIKGLSIFFFSFILIFIFIGLILGSRYHIFGIALANLIVTSILFIITVVYYYKLNNKMSTTG